MRLRHYYFLAAILLLCHGAVFADIKQDNLHEYYQWLEFVHQDQIKGQETYVVYDTQDQSSLWRHVHSGIRYCKTEKFSSSYGSCNGWSLVWLYAKWLQFSHPETGNWFGQAINDIFAVSADSASFFKNTYNSNDPLIAAMNNFLYSGKCSNAKQIIALVNDFQGLSRTEDIAAKINQLLGQYHEQVHSEYTIMAPLDCNQLEQLLKEIVIYDHRLIWIGFTTAVQNIGHAVALFKDGNNYYYYDPNDPLGEIRSTDLAIIAKSIFSSHDTYTKDIPIFELRIFSGEKAPVSYPEVPQVLQKIKVSLRGSAEWEAVLRWAAHQNHPELLQYFFNNHHELTKGVDLNVLSYNDSNTASKGSEVDFSALMLAVRFDNLEIVELLLAKGANPDVVTNVNGYTALMLNTMNPKAGPLIDRLADFIRSATVHQHHPKPFHARKHPLTIAKMLLDRHANVNLVDKHHCSALMYAVEQNSMEMVKLLLAYNADINLVDQYQRTAFTIARARGYTEIAELLQQYNDKKYLNRP